jgi:hypothetical protein
VACGERLVVQVGAFLSGGVTEPVMPGPAGLGAASLTWVRGARRCPGDKMIDWVSPPGGDAAAQSNQAARLAQWRARRPAEADSGSQELAAVVPIG